MRALAVFAIPAGACASFPSDHDRTIRTAPRGRRAKVSTGASPLGMFSEAVPLLWLADPIRNVDKPGGWCHTALPCDGVAPGAGLSAQA
jgi:hypothetical protein